MNIAYYLVNDDLKLNCFAFWSDWQKNTFGNTKKLIAWLKVWCGSKKANNV